MFFLNSMDKLIIAGVELILSAILLQGILCSVVRPVDYIAPVYPCRLEDEFCSTKCSIMSLRGDFNCSFCVCENIADYVKWDTTKNPTISHRSTTPLPPDMIEANGIQYHKVSDPCDMSRDRVCPVKCQEVKSTKPNGDVCTECNCQGNAVLFGRWS